MSPADRRPTSKRKGSAPGKVKRPQKPKPTGEGATSPGVRTRRLAAELVERIDTESAFANLLVPPALGRSQLDERDRRLVTETVYGTTRMRRTCDWLVDRYLTTDPNPTARAFLRIGAYQLQYTDIPPYAAVSATVSATPVKLRPFVNAVLRKLVKEDAPAWPSDGVRLSYPDWIVDVLSTDLGPDVALTTLAAMNERAAATGRDDGYVQDLASQWVAATVGATEGERVLDLCAAPGGKASAMTANGAWVAAADLRPHRAALVANNGRRLRLQDRMAALVADGTAAPFPAGTFDRVLVDAPCSGIGALRRRPDARWRMRPDDVEELVGLQRRLLDASLALVRPGGLLVYSVCTLTAAETEGIDAWLAAEHPAWRPAGLAPAHDGDPAEPSPWTPLGRGHLLLPQARGTDGMYVLSLTTGETSDG